MISVYVENYGCSVNLSESEIIKGLVSEAGHRIETRPDKASVIIINMCSVKTPTERKIIKRITKLREDFAKKPILITGCLPIDWKKKLSKLNVSVVTTHNIHRITEAIERITEGNRVFYDEDIKSIKLCMPKVRKNPIISIVPISSGCNLWCSYCVTTVIKGRLISYPMEKIIQQVKSDLNSGCREIWVTAQDTGAYATESSAESKLPELIKRISGIEGDFFIRVGMMNPAHALLVIEELIDAYKSENVFKFLHLPIQSGNNRVLQEMNRKYTVKDFMQIIRRFRKSFPKITLSTDVICGFPTENHEEFMDTVRVTEEIQPDILNVSRFWPRFGTDAADMPSQIHSSVTKERSRYIVKVFKKISTEKNRRWLGWKGRVLIDEYGKGRSMIGRNYAYKPIVIDEKMKLGDFVNVRIVRAEEHYLVGEKQEK